MRTIDSDVALALHWALAMSGVGGHAMRSQVRPGRGGYIFLHLVVSPSHSANVAHP